MPPLRAKAQLAAWWIAGILGAANLVAIVWSRIHPDTGRAETITAPAAAQRDGSSVEIAPPPTSSAKAVPPTAATSATSATPVPPTSTPPPLPPNPYIPPQE